MRSQNYTGENEVMFIYDLVGAEANEEWARWDELLEDDGINAGEEGFMRGVLGHDSSDQFFV